LSFEKVTYRSVRDWYCRSLFLKFKADQKWKFHRL